MPTTVLRGIVAIGFLAGMWSDLVSAVAEPIAVRISSFTVAPAHTPLAVVLVRNESQDAFQGTIQLIGPDAWRIVPPELEIKATPGGIGRAAFTVQRGTILEENSYPMEVRLTGGGRTLVHRQDVICASAPYFRPKIDGKFDDWKDAIPVTFVCNGKKTAVSTYWNRKQFAFLVAVEEDEIAAWRSSDPHAACDAVQVAISPDDKPTGAEPDQPSGRYEFLLVASGGPSEGRWPGVCFRLADPTTKLGATQAARDLAPLIDNQVELVVTRKEKMTCYECAIPLKSLAELKVGEGREFCFSVLVHDPDGTGIREWGQAAGLWPSERNRMAWSLWPGARWGKDPPYDNKTPWGMCSSKY